MTRFEVPLILWERKWILVANIAPLLLWANRYLIA